MSFADKTYCINLDRRPDRWIAAHAEFEKHGLKVERFAAIDALSFKKEYPCDNANNGCTLSHYFIIERAKLLGLDSVMIFEDDVELHQDLTPFLQICLSWLPKDWDMLYLGGSHRVAPMPIQGTSWILRAQKTLTTHAYIIRSTMFNMVLHSLPSLHQPVDCYFAGWQKEFNVFVTNPPLAWQRKGFSDIAGRDMHYPWLQTNEQH